MDTSIWIDHLRAGDDTLSNLLESQQVLVHPFVIGEVALGNLPDRDLLLRSLHRLPQTSVAKDHEVIHLIGKHTLFGTGIGYVDAHLLTAAKLTPGTHVWTRDKRLLAAAAKLGLSRGLH